MVADDMKHRMMQESRRYCKLCGCDCVAVIYHGAVRAGGLGKYTENSVPIFQCNHCGVIWHEPVIEDTSQYYESEEYRASMEEGSNEAVFYRNHDKETWDKFQYTGTTFFGTRQLRILAVERELS